MSTNRNPDCLRPFDEAAARLEVAADVDARALKRAYRRAVAAHPPDRDPVAFREIRDAYELLSNPEGRLADLALRHAPYTPAPALPPGDALTEAELAGGLVRRWAAHVDSAALLEEAER